MLLSDYIIKRFNAISTRFQDMDVFEFTIGKAKARIIPDLGSRSIVIYNIDNSQSEKILTLINLNTPDFKLNPLVNNPYCFHFPEVESDKSNKFFDALEKILV